MSQNPVEQEIDEILKQWEKEIREYCEVYWAGYVDPGDFEASHRSLVRKQILRVVDGHFVTVRESKEFIKLLADHSKDKGIYTIPDEPLAQALKNAREA